MAINQSYGLDTFALSRAADHGFSVSRVAGTEGESLTPDQNGDVAEWSERGNPSRRGCVESLGAGGTDHVVLGGEGVSPGGWICAKTIAGHVLRLHYLGGSPNAGYRFRLTIYPR
jgi:hypothetical protein